MTLTLQRLFEIFFLYNSRKTPTKMNVRLIAHLTLKDSHGLLKRGGNHVCFYCNLARTRY